MNQDPSKRREALAIKKLASDPIFNQYFYEPVQKLRAKALRYLTDRRLEEADLRYNQGVVHALEEIDRILQKNDFKLRIAEKDLGND